MQMREAQMRGKIRFFFFFLVGVARDHREPGDRFRGIIVE